MIQSNMTVSKTKWVCNHEMLHFYLNNIFGNYTKEHEFMENIEDYIDLPICKKLIERVL